MGWPQAPFATKADVDAHFKRMLDRALAAAARGDVRVGVASHNLFDVAWALHRRRERGLVDAVEIEMLEGMAPAQARGDARHRRVRCCSIRRSSSRRSLQPQLRTCRAGSTRTRRRRTSCAPCSRSRRDPGNGPRSARGSSKRSRLPTTCRPCPRRDQDRRREATPLRRCGAVRQRTRHRLHVAGKPRVDRPASRGERRRPSCRRSSRTTDGIDAVVERARRAGPAWAATSTGDRRRAARPASPK